MVVCILNAVSVHIRPPATTQISRITGAILRHRATVRSTHLDFLEFPVKRKIGRDLRVIKQSLTRHVHHKRHVWIPLSTSMRGARPHHHRRHDHPEGQNRNYHFIHFVLLFRRKLLRHIDVNTRSLRNSIAIDDHYFSMNIGLVGEVSKTLHGILQTFLAFQRWYYAYDTRFLLN